MTNYLYNNDIPDNLNLGKSIAIDTETLGLNILSNRDRLCLVQLSNGKDAHMVCFNKDSYNAPNLIKLLKNNFKEKIFHFARFDVTVLQKTFNIDIDNIYCTKIASKLARTYTDAHGLKALIKEFFNIEISKKEQSSYWGQEKISEQQLIYAANDVIYLHKIQQKLNEILIKEKRFDLFQKTINCLKTIIDLDIAGWTDSDIFAH